MIRRTLALAVAALLATSCTQSVAAPLGVGQGGTGAELTGADDEVLVGDGSSAYAGATMPDCDDTGGNHINYDQTTNTFTCGTSGAGVSDHGALTGLGDDDHTQYCLADGSRAFTGTIDAGGNGITDLGDVTFKTGASGGTLRTGTSNADKFELQAYDVDGGVYVKVAEADAANDVTFEVFDGSFTIRNTADEAKRIGWDASGITTSNTRTITMPDVDVDLAANSGNFAAATHASRHESGGADAVNHDSLTGFVADEHIDWTSATQDFSTSGSATTGNAIPFSDDTYDLGAGCTGGISSMFRHACFSQTLSSPTVRGSITTGGNLTLQSTSHATKGSIFFGSSSPTYYDEAAQRFFIGDGSITQRIDSVLHLIAKNASATGTQQAFKLTADADGVTPGVGFGTRFVMASDNNGEENRTQARFTSRWTDATDATRTSALDIEVSDGGSVTQILTIDPSGLDLNGFTASNLDLTLKSSGTLNLNSGSVTNGADVTLTGDLTVDDIISSAGTGDIGTLATPFSVAYFDTLDVNTGGSTFYSDITTSGNANILVDGYVRLDQRTGDPSLGVGDHGAIYTKDVSGTAEVFAIDEGGTAQQLTAHRPVDEAIAVGIDVPTSDPFPQVRYDSNAYVGVECFTYTNPNTRLTDRKCRDLPASEIRDWDADQEQAIAESRRARAACLEAARDQRRPCPEIREYQPPPRWIAERIELARQRREGAR